jgi:PncC family amidohydrolase
VILRDLSAEIGKLLTAAGKTLAVAESCTGGFISHNITLIPGSSVYFKGSIVAYDNSIKVSFLGVREETLKKFGAVSVESVGEMAAGILKNYEVDIAVSTTGIAGPGGETLGKPIGTVCIGIATKENIFAERFQFSGTREEIIKQSTKKALELLFSKIK